MENLIETLQIIAGILVAAYPVIQIIVNLTPTKKDNNVFDIVKKAISFIFPNLKSGGGVHEDNIIVKKK